MNIEMFVIDPTPEEPLTLGKLIDINAFQHEERIQEISGQASSEASLEGILKRVSRFSCQFKRMHRLFRSKIRGNQLNFLLFRTKITKTFIFSVVRTISFNYSMMRISTLRPLPVRVTLVQLKLVSKNGNRISIYSVKHLMPGRNVKKLGNISNQFLVHRIFNDNYQLKPKCSVKLIKHLKM